jgi:hypothetical protein
VGFLPALFLGQADSRSSLNAQSILKNNFKGQIGYEKNVRKHSFSARLAGFLRGLGALAKGVLVKSNRLVSLD